MVLAFWNPQSIKEQNDKHKLANFKVCQKVLRAMEGNKTGERVREGGKGTNLQQGGQ